MTTIYPITYEQIGKALVDFARGCTEAEEQTFREKDETKWPLPPTPPAILPPFIDQIGVPSDFHLPMREWLEQIDTATDRK